MMSPHPDQICGDCSQSHRHRTTYSPGFTNGTFTWSLTAMYAVVWPPPVCYRGRWAGPAALRQLVFGVVPTFVARVRKPNVARLVAPAVLVTSTRRFKLRRVLVALPLVLPCQPQTSRHRVLRPLRPAMVQISPYIYSLLLSKGTRSFNNGTPTVLFFEAYLDC